LGSGDRVVARAVDLAAHVDAHGPECHGLHVELRVLHIGLELLGEEVAQLLHCEPLHVKGPQPGQVDGTVGPDREGAAELRDVEKLHLQAVAWAEDVSIVHDTIALQTRAGLRGDLWRGLGRVQRRLQTYKHNCR